MCITITEGDRFLHGFSIYLIENNYYLLQERKHGPNTCWFNAFHTNTKIKCNIFNYDKDYSDYRIAELFFILTISKSKSSHKFYNFEVA